MLSVRTRSYRLETTKGDVVHQTRRQVGCCVYERKDPSPRAEGIALVVARSEAAEECICPVKIRTVAWDAVIASAFGSR